MPAALVRLTASHEYSGHVRSQSVGPRTVAVDDRDPAGPLSERERYAAPETGTSTHTASMYSSGASGAGR